jgi:hypothetical protein
MKTKNLIEAALSLPVEERAVLTDFLLRSFNTIDADIDDKWLEAAKRRLGELKSGEVEGIPAGEVFSKLRNRFAK